MNPQDQIQRLFEELMRAASDTLSDEEVAEVRHFAEVNELPLALETLADIYVEEQKTPSASAIQLAERLARELNIEPAFIIRRMKRGSS